jgi:hypothetical protein
MSTGVDDSLVYITEAATETGHNQEDDLRKSPGKGLQSFSRALSLGQSSNYSYSFSSPFLNVRERRLSNVS